MKKLAGGVEKYTSKEYAQKQKKQKQPTKGAKNASQKK